MEDTSRTKPVVSTKQGSYGLTEIDEGSTGPTCTKSSAIPNLNYFYGTPDCVDKSVSDTCTCPWVVFPSIGLHCLVLM